MAAHDKIKFSELVGQAATGVLSFAGFVVSMAGIVEFEMMALAVGMPILSGGVFGFLHLRKQYQKRVEQDLESKLLELFALYKQNLSVAQVALMTKLPTDDIQAQMDKLQKKGVVEINVTETGAVVYQVPQLGTNQNTQDWLMR